MNITPLQSGLAVAGVAALAAIGAAGLVLSLDDATEPAPVELTTVDDADTDRSTSGPAGEPTPSTSDTAPAAGEPSDTTATPRPAATSIDEAAARAEALRWSDGGEVVRVAPDRDDGRAEWEVRIRHAEGWSVEVTLDAEDGRLRELDVEDRGRVAPDAARIDADAARTVLLDAFPGADIRDLVGDDDDGRPAWEAVLQDGDGRWLEATVDGVDGRLVEVDVED